MIWKRNPLNLSQLKSGFVADRQVDVREVSAGAKGRCGDTPHPLRPPLVLSSLPIPFQVFQSNCKMSSFPFLL